MRKYSKYIISLSIILLLVIQMDANVLWKGFQESSLSIFVIATIFILGQILFLNLRWHAYLNCDKVRVSFETSVLINLAGYFANLLLLTSVGGIIAKSGLAIKCGVSVMHSVFATFIDRFMTLFVLVILSALGLPLLQHTLDSTILTMLGLTISLIIFAIVLAITLLRLGTFKDFILSNRKRSQGIATLRRFLENYDLMTKTFVYSLIAQICFILCVYTLFQNFDTTEINTVHFLAIIPILALISSMPISFGGWGVREGAFVYGLGLLGFSPENAFLLSIQVGLVTLIAPFIVGLPYIIKGNTDILKKPA